MTEDAASEFTLDDLPAFSPWPARLLGLEIWQPVTKTPAAVQREFEQDKWGRLLTRYWAGNRATTVEAAEEWSLNGPEEVLCSIGGRFELLALSDALQRHREVVAEVLSSQMPAPGLVELGAGFGAVILRLATDPRFRSIPLSAAEYTQSGAALMSELARNAGIDLQIGQCDLGSETLTNLSIAPGAVVFTCMAAHYIPELQDGFVHALLRLRPKVVIHFEPCYEHCDLDTLTGVLRRKYIQMNDYNRNLMTLLRRHADIGAIRILQETAAVIGVNPLLPISVIVWAAAP